MYTVESLARLLLDEGMVAFAFIDESKGGERNVVSVRESDEWDRIDSVVDGTSDVDGKSFLVIGYPRHGRPQLETSLIFKDEGDAGKNVVRTYLALKRAEQ